MEANGHSHSTGGGNRDARGMREAVQREGAQDEGRGTAGDHIARSCGGLQGRLAQRAGVREVQAAIAVKGQRGWALETTKNR